MAIYMMPCLHWGCLHWGWGNSMADYYIGIMTGTSLDGADIALVDFTGDSHKLIAFETYDYPDGLKESILSVNQNQPTTISAIGDIDCQLGHFFARATNQFLQIFHIDNKDVRAIGCHGQTLWHQPTGQYRYSMQLGNSSILANQTHIDVVSDFRGADMALGGQGAPLAPAYHHQLLSHPNERRIVVNIGGIANITCLIPNQDGVGYDTGTGNILMDGWIDRHQHVPYDKNGDWARSSTADVSDLVAHLLDDDWIKKPYPKSTGREYFNQAWLDNKLKHYGKSLPPVDVQSALVDFTAQSITEQINSFKPDALIVCGGGACNDYLMERLSYFAPCSVQTTAHYGINGDALESMMFAWFARQHILGETATITTVTGASRPAILGALYRHTPHSV